MNLSRRLVPHLIGASAAVLDALVYLSERLNREEFASTDAFIPIALILAFLPLIVCPHWTITPFLTLVAFGLLVALLMPVYSPFAGLCVAVYRIAARCRASIATAGLLVSAVVFAIGVVNSTGRGDDTYPAETLIASVLVWLLLLLIPWVLGRLGFAAARRAEDRAARQALSAAMALQSERVRLARELHDIVSHSVSAMILQAAGARAGPHDEARTTAALEAVETTGVQAMRELHRLLGLLRSVEEAQSGDTAGTGLETLADLEPLLQTVRSCDVDVTVEVDGTPRTLDPSIEHAAYRVVQECLANVIKHAGRQATARVHISWESAELMITVRSTPGLVDQEPRPDLSTGLGLRGLRERIDLVGGRFEAGPASDGAFLAFAALPFVRAPEPATAIESR